MSKEERGKGKGEGEGKCERKHLLLLLGALRYEPFCLCFLKFRQCLRFLKDGSNHTSWLPYIPPQSSKETKQYEGSTRSRIYTPYWC